MLKNVYPSTTSLWESYKVIAHKEVMIMKDGNVIMPILMCFDGYTYWEPSIKYVLNYNPKILLYSFQLNILINKMLQYQRTLHLLFDGTPSCAGKNKKQNMDKERTESRQSINDLK